MKCISIRQPWASLIVSGAKDIENRDWKTKYRGRILIHAGVKFDQESYDMLRDDVMDCRGLMAEPNSYQRGGVIGMADLVDCVNRSDSKWFTGQYGFVMANARPVRFIPCRGYLSIFNLRIDESQVIPC